jgi:predicted peptidase
MKAETLKDGDFVLKYRIHIPEGLKPGETVPLVLIFHGAGERGDDNKIQLTYGAPELLAYLEKKGIPAIIIAPQCPAEMQWVDVPWTDDSHIMPKEPSIPMHAAMKLLKQSMSSFPADKWRIYVTGMSMGGFGTWDITQREPELFAAAIPICGGGDTREAAQLKELPIWAFHGEQDPVVKVIRSRNMIEAVKKAGGNPEYTEYPAVEHGSWQQTYANDAVWDWLFAQRKR